MRAFFIELFDFSAAGAYQRRIPDYLLAILAALVGVLARAGLESLLTPRPMLIISFLPVILVAWLSGFWPAFVAMVVAMTTLTFFYIPPYYSLAVQELPDQIDLALFFFGGIGCALLGEAQRQAKRRAERSLADSLQRQTELQAEIARRVEVERQFHSTAEQFRTLADGISQLAWMARPDGHIYWYNQRWYDYTGTSPDQMEGWGWQSVHDPEMLPEVLTRWRASIATGTPFDMVFPLRGADGVFRPFLTRILPIREDGRIVHWFGTNTDITEQKRLQEDLRLAVERFRILLESLPGLVWTADPTGEMTYFNQRWIDYTGISVEQARGNGWGEAIHPDDLPGLMANLQRAVTHGESSQYEYRIRRHRDGEFRYHLAYAVPLRDQAGSVIQWVGSITDIDAQRRQADTLEHLVHERTLKLRQEIDERIKAEQQVEEMVVELRRSNGELEQFAYVASHDLQEPLRKIQAFGDRMAARFRDEVGEQGQDYIDRMKASAARMQQLINDLLTFSRVSTRPRTLAEVDLNRVAREVVSDLEGRILQTGGEVRLGPLPAVEADASQMRQLLQNLIGNALKFHRPDVAPLVTVSGGKGDEGSVWIEVSDNGIGFDEKYSDRIFQVFQRLHGKGVYEGTGIGLAICKKIVERHTGTITARGKPGEGSTFFVTLPGRQKDAQPTREAGGDDALVEAHHDPDGRR